MELTDDPYEYGDASTDGGLGGDEAPEGCENGGDPVIVDGKTVSFRSYRRHETG